MSSEPTDADREAALNQARAIRACAEEPPFTPNETPGESFERTVREIIEYERAAAREQGYAQGREEGRIETSEIFAGSIEEAHEESYERGVREAHNADREAALAIQRDLDGRKGFDLYALDDEVREEILAVWSGIVAAAREQGYERGREEGRPAIAPRAPCRGGGVTMDRALKPAHYTDEELDAALRNLHAGILPRHMLLFGTIEVRDQRIRALEARLALAENLVRVIEEYEPLLLHHEEVAEALRAWGEGKDG